MRYAPGSVLTIPGSHIVRVLEARGDDYLVRPIGPALGAPALKDRTPYLISALDLERLAAHEHLL